MYEFIERIYGESRFWRSSDRVYFIRKYMLGMYNLDSFQPSDIPFVLKRYPIFGCSLKFIFFETHETNLLFIENNQNPIFQLTDEKHIMNDYF